MKSLQVAAIMAVALFSAPVSANTADADCAVASLPTVFAYADCMTAAGDDATAQEACKDGLADDCPPCIEAAAANMASPNACFPASAAGDCTVADFPAVMAMAACSAAAGEDGDAQAACLAAISNACILCTMERGEGFVSCFAAAAAGDCVGADMTAMTTMDTCSTAAADDADAEAACGAAFSAALTPKCLVCTASNAAAATQANEPANPFVCFDMAATATTECCKEGGGLDDVDKVGASVECLTAAVLALTAEGNFSPPEADCGAGDPNPATIAAACKAWIKPNILGAGEECPAPAPEGQGTPALGTSAPTLSVPFAASVALVLVALRLH